MRRFPEADVNATNMLLAGLMVLSTSVQAEDLSATLDWAGRYSLGSCANARVTAVHVDVGDAVEAGQVLVELDPAPSQARIDSALAALARARPELDERELELVRAEELFDRTVLSEGELRQAEIHQEIAAAEVANAEAQVRIAELGLECRIVRSPVRGVVVKRNVQIGDPVAGRVQAPTLVAVARSGAMDAVGQVSLDLLDSIAVGDRLFVRTHSPRTEGQVVHVGLEPVTHNPLRYTLRVRFQATIGGMTRAGAPAVIELP